MALSTELFDYDLPERLIAQAPAAKRDASRLLVVDRATRTLAHHAFSDLPKFLKTGDILFRNNAAVLPARLYAHRPTGGAVECFLLRPAADPTPDTWWCLLRPGKKLPVGATFSREQAFQAVVTERNDDGIAKVRFTCAPGDTIVAVANRLGEIPLPPYITREGKAEERERDVERYQTVYANRERQVAVAAPTAGLHFTDALFAQLQGAGIQTADMTLHVGLGTFKPIETATIEEHPIHREVYEIPVRTQELLFKPTGRRIAVGTTSVRSVEDFLTKNSAPLQETWTGEAGIYVFPPRRLGGVDALITNFHQPRSTLLCLVSAFLTPGSTDGIAWLKEIYREAIELEYRFFSYGDAMLIL